MQLTETVTIINKSGKVISNGKHIVNIFKEAKAAYQDKKAALKAERAAAAPRPAVLRKAHTFDVRTQVPYDQEGEAQLEYYEQDGHVYALPVSQRRHFLPLDDDEYTSRHLDDGRSQRSRRSGTTHRPRKALTSSASSAVPRAGPGTALTESNLRALTEVSSSSASATPTHKPAPRAAAYRSPYAESAPRDLSRATSALSLDTAEEQKKKKKKQELEMHLAYGSIPPDLASRTDLGPVNEQEQQAADAEAQTRTLLSRIDALLDEAACAQHTAAAVISHLQETPEAAAAVALLLAELSALLKTSPAFLGLVKGGFPAVFALLASPQFLVGVGAAVGVTVVFFGGWRIVKRIRGDARMAVTAKEDEEQQQQQQEAYEMQQPHAAQAYREPGAPSEGSYYDDALVVEEELSTIETWRRGITPYGCDDDEQDGVDLELITPSAVRSVRGDAASVRTGRTHRSHKSHRSHRSRREEDAADGASRDVPASEAGSARSRRTTRSKATTAVRTERLAIEDGSRQEDNTLDAVLRPKESKKPNMLRTLFKKKKEKEDTAVSVMV